MIGIETANQLTDARIVGPVTHGDYMRQDAERGDVRHVMSRSELKSFADCPSKWIKGAKEEASAAMSWGDLLDCIVFTKAAFDNRFIVPPATYMGKGKKKNDPPIEKPWTRQADICEKWEKDQEAQGLTVVKKSDWDKAQSARAALFADPLISELLGCSKFQVLATADYKDKATGIIVPLKVAVDIVPDRAHPVYGDCLADLKSCQNANPWVYENEAERYWYEAQASLYCDVFEAAGDFREMFRHVIVENFPPFETGTRFFSIESRNIGRMKYQVALMKYCQCLATDVWPKYEQHKGQGRLNINGWLAIDPTKRSADNI